MAFVTDLVLIIPRPDYPDDYLRQDEQCERFVRIFEKHQSWRPELADPRSQDKGSNAVVYVLGVNYLHQSALLEDLLADFSAQDWIPGTTLLLQRENDEYPRIVVLGKIPTENVVALDAYSFPNLKRPPWITR